MQRIRPVGRTQVEHKSTGDRNLAYDRHVYIDDRGRNDLDHELPFDDHGCDHHLYLQTQA